MRKTLITALLATGIAPAALAQQVPAGGAAPTAADDRAAPSGLEDIVVTASRREERLQDVPISVTALTGATLETTGITQTYQIQQVTPGLVIARNTSILQPTIRGVGSRAATAGDESNVSIYVDGIYQPEPFGGTFDLLEVERVEVLRGPQGTLFGRNSTGGLINVITPDPKFETSGNVTVRAGNFSELSAKAYVTTGLSDTVAVDIAGLVYDDGGYVRNLAPNGDRLGTRNSKAVRSKLLFEPSDSARFVVTANYSRQKDNAALSPMPLDGNTVGRARGATIIPEDPWTAALSFTPISDIEQYGTSLQTRFKLGGVNLETTTAYQHNDLYSFTDSDASTVDVSSFENHTVSRNVSQEIRLLSPGGGDFQWIVGVYAFRNTANYDPTRLRSGGVVTSTQFARNRTDSLAGFAEGTYTFGPLSITAGGRYSYERRHFSFTNITAARTLSDSAETSFKKFTPRASVQYRFADRSQIYASYSRGFKSGVFNTGNTAANPTAVKPEILDAYEVGIKAEPLSWLRTNLSAFHYDYTNIQISIRDPLGVSILQNAGTAKMKGGEAEITAAPFAGFNVRIAAAYLDAKYNKFPNAIVTIPLPGGGNSQISQDASGKRAIRSPKFTINLGADYEHEFKAGTLLLTGNVYRSAKFYWDPYNRLAQRAYTQVNAQIGWRLPGDQLTFTLYGENLLNKAIESNVVTSALADYATYQRPRSYGIQAKVAF